jgi:hypothetical protein
MMEVLYRGMFEYASDDDVMYSYDLKLEMIWLQDWILKTNIYIGTIGIFMI